MITAAAWLGIDWSGVGTASGAALLTAIASFLLALAALVNSIRDRHRNGKNGKNGGSPPAPPPSSPP